MLELNSFLENKSLNTAYTDNRCLNKQSVFTVRIMTQCAILLMLTYFISSKKRRHLAWPHFACSCFS